MIPSDTQFGAKEVAPPTQNWCHSGHFAPEVFAREGAGTEALPMRFFSVGATSDPGVNGIYCEACLIIANAMAHKARFARG
jgi:hypothetical protein